MKNIYLLNGSIQQAQNLCPMPHPNILVCTFASHTNHSMREVYESFRQGYKLARVERFTEQVEACDILVLCGGDSPTLINTLKGIDGWREVLHNKVIVAYSAGVSALMQYSYNLDHHRIVEGLGIIPMQSIVHWRPTLWACHQALMLAHPDIPIVTVNDGEYYQIQE